MNLIFIGFGKVGQSLAELIELRHAELRREYGLSARVVGIVDRGGAAISKEGIDLSKAVYVKRLTGSVSNMHDVGRPYASALEVLEEENADITVEITSTNIETGEPGLSHIKKALSSGRQVVTTNKGILALFLPYLADLASKNGASLKFSGSVGGAMPIIEFAKNCLYGEKIDSIRGILNGTTNYILSRMAEKNLDLSSAIKEAKELGYAEENVLNDLDGLDTACKLVILANWVLNRKVTLSDVKVNGIRDIPHREILKAQQEGYAIKLIGSITEEITVSPERISLKDPLCVASSLNAIVFSCTHSGEHILIGRGAGPRETASSILRDIVSIQKSPVRQNITALCLNNEYVKIHRK